MADDNYENDNNDNNNAGGGDYDDGSTNDDTWALFSQKDDRSCKVYDNDDFFTIFVQLLLAAFALGSLYLKRMREVPRRTFSTWALDVSKQGVGACYAHVCNMVGTILCVVCNACGENAAKLLTRAGAFLHFIIAINQLAHINFLLCRSPLTPNTRPLQPSFPSSSMAKQNWTTNVLGTV